MSTNSSIVEYAWALLQAGVKHPDGSIRFAAAEALADLLRSDGLEDLQAGLSAKDAALRDRAIVALGKLQWQSQSPFFIKALDDVDPLVRGHALQALVATGGANSLDYILKCLRDPNQFVQECAVGTLHAIKKAGEPILEAVATAQQGFDCVYMARISAAFYLASAQNAAGKKILYQILECDDSWIAFLAAKKLADLDDPKGMDRLTYMLKWGNWSEKIVALEGLVKLEKLDNLTNTLYRPSDIPDPVTRLDVVRLLDRFSPDKTVTYLQQALSGKDDNAKIRALEILGELKRPELIAIAEEILNKGPEYLRATVLMSIEKIGVPALIPKLVPLLERSHWLVRLQAARVVLKLQSMK